MTDSKRVYLDWAATTPIRAEAIHAMQPYFEVGDDTIGANANPNSLHTPGRQAFQALEDARVRIARALEANRPDEILFTSGATEGNNAALFGLVSAAVKQKRLEGVKDFIPHIVTTQIEHDSVLAPCKVLKALGCDITYLTPDSQGLIDTQSLKDALTPNTVVVSVQMVNNEIGSIQPIEQFASITHANRSLFHVDAVQALGKVPLSIKDIDPDALTVSAHKISGPKGVGALYLKTRIPFDAFLVGGGQEGDRRSGTHNVANIVGFAAACEQAVSELPEVTDRLIGLRTLLYEQLAELEKVYPSVEVAPASPHFAPHIVSICVEGMESETLLLRLDAQGYAVSGGSACATNSLKPSRVLRAIGVPESRIQGALRISLGHATTLEDVNSLPKALQAAITP